MRKSELLAALNDDLWSRFVATYAALDSDGFLDLYSPDLVRAGGPGREILGYSPYADGIRDWFANLRARGSTPRIEFRFSERIATEDLASERGAFRIVATNVDGDQRIFYGGFHTFARHIDGRWRFIVDYESTDVDQSAFEAAYHADDVAAFVS